VSSFKKSKDHLNDIVIPNLSEAKDTPLNQRRVFNVVASLDTLVAQIWWELPDYEKREWSGGKSRYDDTDFREALANKYPDYRLVRDIAKAQKHVSLTRGYPQLTNSSQIKKGTMGFGEGGFGEGPYGGGEQTLVVKDDGTKRNVLATVQNSLESICSEFGIQPT
jgi:hypothetical protein